MRVALLHNINRGGCDKELEFDYPGTIDSIERNLSIVHSVERIECTQNISAWVSKLSRFAPDIAFNVAEGYFGSARESFFPNLLEQMRIPYVGSDPTTMLFGQNKALSKRLASRIGVRTPRWRLIRHISESKRILGTLSFPLFVKPNTEGSSLGIDPGAMVSTCDELQGRVEHVLRFFKSAALVEEFIPKGADLSFSFVEGLGDTVFGPVTYDIGDSQIYDFDWKKRSFKFPALVVPYNLLSNTERAELISGFVTLLQALNVRGYARADYRISKEGTPYFLEINTQVEMAEKAEFAAPVITAGYTFQEILLHMVDQAYTSRFSIPSTPDLHEPHLEINNGLH